MDKSYCFKLILQQESAGFEELLTVDSTQTITIQYQYLRTERTEVAIFGNYILVSCTFIGQNVW